MAPTGPLVLRRRRPRAPAVSCLVLASVAAALAAIGSPAERVAGIASVAVFVALAAVLLISRGRPVLVVDDVGLAGAALPAGPLPWSRITGVVEHRLRGQHVLCVLVDDPEAVLAATGDPDVRAVLRADLAMLDTPVTIPLRMLPIGVERLTLALATHTAAALPAALRAHADPDVTPRPPADWAALDALARSACGLDAPLPLEYLELLREQDGYQARGLRVYGSSGPGPGVVEANRAWRAAGGPSEHLVLAEDAAHRYTSHPSSGTFHVLTQSDRRSVRELSTFRDLMVIACSELLAR